MGNVAERVKQIVAEHLGLEKEKVIEESSFVEDLGADSLEAVELMMVFEDEFNVEIHDDIAERIKTVGNAIEFIKENAPKENAA